MRRQSFAFLLLLSAAPAAVSAVKIVSVASRSDASGEEGDVVEEVVEAEEDGTRILRLTGGAHRGHKRTVNRQPALPRTARKHHVRADKPAELVRMSNPLPPPSCAEWELVEDDCIIDDLFWQDYDMFLKNVSPTGQGQKVLFDVEQFSAEMCQYREDIEYMFVSAFPSNVDAGTSCGLLQDVDCGDKGKFSVDVDCDGQDSVYVDVFSREGLRLKNDVPNGILVPAACQALAGQNPGAFNRNYMCHKRFQVSCEQCQGPS